MTDLPLLSILIFLPLLGALIAAVMPRSNESLLRGWSVAVSLLVFITSLGLWFGFDSTSPDFQYIERVPWVPGIGVTYQVGVDGIICCWCC